MPCILRIVLGEMQPAYRASLLAWERLGFHQIIFCTQPLQRSPISDVEWRSVNELMSPAELRQLRAVKEPAHCKDLLSLLALQRLGGTYMDLDVMPAPKARKLWPRDNVLFASEALRMGKRWAVRRKQGLSLSVLRVPKNFRPLARLIAPLRRMLFSQQRWHRGTRQWMNATVLAAQWVRRERLVRFVKPPSIFRPIPVWIKTRKWKMKKPYRAYGHAIPCARQIRNTSVGIDMWHGHFDNPSSLAYNPGLLKCLNDIIVAR